MPEFTLIFGVVIFFAVALLIFLTAKTVLHSLSLVLMLLFVLSGILGVFVVKDAIELRDKLSVSDNLVVLADGSSALTGFVLSEQPEILSEEASDDLNTGIAGGSTTGDYYKVFIVDIKIMDELPSKEIKFLDETYSAEKVKSALLSPNIANELGIVVSSSNEEIKASLFSVVFSEYILGDPLVLFEQYKEGNVRVKPESAVFQFMKFAPIGLIKTIIGNAFDVAEKQAKQLEEELEE